MTALAGGCIDVTFNGSGSDRVGWCFLVWAYLDFLMFCCRIFLDCLFGVLGCFVCGVVAAVEPRIVGYSMNPASEIVQEHSGKYISDIIVFSVEPNADGTINLSHVSEAGFVAARSLRDRYGVDVHLAVGGWGRSEHFGVVCRSLESRAVFIAGLLALCEKYGLSGIDFDWEFPEGEQEYLNFADLIVESKRVLEPRGVLVTTALAPWQRLRADACVALDRLHLMAYDFRDKHSTLEKSKEAVEGFLKLGVPASKIYLGVPFYGRDLTKPERSVTYESLVSGDKLTADMDEVAGVYFNGIETISAKTEYALELGLGGIMIWELSQDTRDELSLLGAIHNVLTR